MTKRDKTTGTAKPFKPTTAPEGWEDMEVIPPWALDAVMQSHDNMLEKMVSYAHEEFTRLQAEREKLLTALMEVGTALRCIFSALLFDDSEKWTEGLIRLRSQYNDRVSSAVDLVHASNIIHFELVLQQPGQEAVFYPIERELLSTASAVNDAIRGATGDGDGGKKLHELANHSFPDIIEILEEITGGISTNHFMVNYGGDRGALHLAFMMIHLEDQNGIKSLEQQWKTSWQRLKSTRARAIAKGKDLTGNPLAAYEYLNYKKPFDMPANERRMFEQRMSQLKKVARARQLTTNLQPES